MPTVYETSVSKERMLSLFSASDIEQPFRFQPFVKFIVPFDEYVGFVRLMLSYNANWLSFKGTVYQQALRDTTERSLRQLYYFDISSSVMSEVSLADLYSAEATLITHEFGYVCETTDIDRMSYWLSKYPYGARAKAKESLESNLDSYRGFDESSLSTHNRELYLYALFLRVQSFTAEPIRFNITEQ